MKEYRASGHISDETAREVGSYLDAKYGGAVIPAEVFVSDASSPDSPLHKHLEWDGRKAAREYRLQQARNVMNSILIVVSDAGGGETRTRAYHKVRYGDAEGYIRQQEVWSDAILQKQVIDRALNELIGWETRYAQYEEFAQVHSAIRRHRKKVAA